MKFFILLFFLSLNAIVAQSQEIYGRVISEGEGIPFANVVVLGTEKGTSTDINGTYRITGMQPGEYTIQVSAIGYTKKKKHVLVSAGSHVALNFTLESDDLEMQEVVVTGTLKEVSRLDSPVPVEVYSPAFFKMNPTPTLFDAMQNINGVRPQLNCNVCNTGDIHVNGLEGPYTMILVDGMPIVSGLSTVYGLSGIPNAMVRRIEVVKGPASSLYGSEAVGGLINVITKEPTDAPAFSADITASHWQEYNLDLGAKFTLGDKTAVLSGINYYNYSYPMDSNGDNFTDVTLQDRVSVFQKWDFKRAEDRQLSFATRFLYEDRWGGEMQWKSADRGGEEVYGESIYTKRWEVIGRYQLPVKEKMLVALSYNAHNQNSYYGNVAYMADQNIAFTQFTWDKSFGKHDVLLGTALRYTYYDDNTTATSKETNFRIKNKPDVNWLPGIFFQDNISLSEKQRLLLGIRYDYNSSHGNIYTPRLAYKYTFNESNILRLNAGTGFRVVNIFTEDHAALTGAREVVIAEGLAPERSYNVNINYIKKLHINNNAFLDIDATVWHTYFNNQILPDYDTDPNKIIYDNLNGHAVTQGLSLNFDLELLNGLKILAGGSFIDVYTIEEDARGKERKTRPVLTEKWTGTWAVTYPIAKINLAINYTGNLYGPMRLPLLGDLDPRSGESPWWSIQNIQFTWSKPRGNWEIYGGIKNLLNFTPPANSIARAHDPFDRLVEYNDDRLVEYNEQNQVIPTPENPHALTFDPSYVYAPNQGIRGFLGVRVTFDD